MDHVCIINVADAILARKDPYNHHGANVSTMSMKIAMRIKDSFSEEHLEHLSYSSRLHDVGKILLDDVLLNYPRRLTDGEYARMQTHVLLGYDLLRSLDCHPAICTAVWQHHEHFDGSGYPRGLQGNDISMFARIICVADVWDSITHERAYRSAMPFERALKEMDTITAWFDPDVYAAFQDVIKEQDDDQ